MATELIPVVDLRLLSQAELNTLSHSCPNAFDLRRCDDIVVPKIDRSVFNESAGSRKQTYSRLRLAPHKPSPSPSSSSSSGAGAAASAAGQRPRGLLSSHSAAGDGGDEDETGRRENQQIVSHLRRLFAQEDPSFSSPATATDPPQNLTLDPPPHAPAGRNVDPVSNGCKAESLALVPVQDRDREVLNPKGVAVDLVALGEKVDPFGEELRRRTEGLSKEEELLGFLNGLDGQWGSRRRRRKIVDASGLGDHLPKGWKLLLGLKRKEGVAWVNCRRYVSPNGHQFVTCKEVSSYLLSLVGQPNSLIQVSVETDGRAAGLAGSSAAGIYQQNGAAKENQTLPSTSSLSIDHEKQVALYLGERKAAEELRKGYVCSECKLTFIDKEVYLEHRLRCQGASAKRRRLHKSIGEGVIVKDGKYECQFCHKTFNERQRYNGHMGAHVRYQGLSAEALSDEASTQRIITASPLNVAYSDPKEMSALPEESERAVISTHNCVQTVENCEVHKPEILGVSRTDKSFDNQKSLEIADKSGEIPHVGDQIICQDVMDNKSKEILRSSNVMDKESNGCAAISSMLCSNVSTIAVHKLAGVSQEGPTDKCADIQVVVSNVDFSKCEDVAKISNIEDMKPLSSQNTDFDTVDLKSEEVDGARNQEEIKLNPSSDTLYPLANKDNEICKDADKAARLSSLAFSPDAIGNDSDKNDFRSQVSVDINDAMVFQPNGCINYISSSVMDVDREKTVSELDLASSSMIPEFGNYGREQSGALENHLIGFSSDGPCYDTEKYSTDIFTSNIAGNILVGMDIPIAELKTDLANCHELFEKDTVSKGTVTDTVDASSCSNPCFHGHTSAIEPNAGCTFDIDTKESMFQGLDKPDHELENRFNSSNSGYEEAGASATTGINGERNYLQFNLTGLSSWTYSADGIPIVNMITPQCEDYLGGIGEKQENLPGVEELRLGPSEPFDFLNLTNQSSLPLAESTQVFGYPTQAENGSCPSLELGWDLSSPKVVGGYPYTSMCVWCSREFSHGGANPEQQSDTLGFICPACKERISGHLNVLQNGSSTLR
ncbi:Methyl-CpG-binding domain-containing protein 8 [Ananas comosus]|uniref:Methyl-CpG-binding domain-containing protein 8 n=1 Tax=Ananas comosus TaxID=4615 RepID=A0A199UGF7_ANACO|nr:Methyl-CpG-binding domain-containing protein 8 [Ananas comosus]